MTKYGLKVICDTYKREVKKREAFEDCKFHVLDKDIEKLNEGNDWICYDDLELTGQLDFWSDGEEKYIAIESINFAVDQVFEETVKFYGLV